MSEEQAVLEARDAEMANARLDTHQAVCNERYGNIDHKLNEIKAALLTQGSDFHARLNTISSRMWSLVIATMGGAVLGLGTLSLYLITKGAK